MRTRTKSGAAIVVAILAVCLNAQPALAQLSAELTERGRLALTNRQFDTALSDLDKAIEADAANPLAHYYRGVALGNVGRERDALGAFLRAAELNPGWGEAHRMATIAALNTRNLPVAWDQAVKAHQSGSDIGDSINRLLALEKAPGDLDEQLAAARVFVMPLNTEKLEARQDNPFGREVLSGGGTAADIGVGGGGGGGIIDPFATSASRSTNVGGRQVAESQGDFYSLLMQTRRSLADSRYFGVVPRQDMAQYLLVIEIDEMGGSGGSQKPIRGYIKLIDPRNGAEAYRRLLELRNIASLADLNADMERYVDLMEEWLRNRSG